MIEVRAQDHTFQAVRESIVDGAPETARRLAEHALEIRVAPLDAINCGFVPGTSHVGEQFALRAMFLPDMMAAAEAMKAAMSVLEPELKKQGTERPSAGTVILGTTKRDIHARRWSVRCSPRMDSPCATWA